jgi:AmiR/NasT family two-component response regulator
MLDELAVGPLRVLIAEDETIIRMDLRGLLEKNGMMVVAEAANGLQAVELAGTETPDVAILDLRMPVLDGVEAARRIYAERPIPIVMLTAFSDRANVEHAIAAGVFSYLVKPFRETDVIPAVRAAVVRHAELLRAQRTLGEKPVKALFMSLPSPSGHAWNVRVAQKEDGTVDVRGVIDA